MKSFFLLTVAVLIGSAVYAQSKTVIPFRTDSTMVLLNNLDSPFIAPSQITEIEKFKLTCNDTSMRVNSFRFVFVPKTGEAAMANAVGPYLSDWSSEYLNKAKSGDRILFDKIEVIDIQGDTIASGHLFYELQ